MSRWRKGVTEEGEEQRREKMRGGMKSPVSTMKTAA